MEWLLVLMFEITTYFKQNILYAICLLSEKIEIAGYAKENISSKCYRYYK